MKKINERGSILLVFILTLPFLIMMAMYYMQLSLTSYQVARFDELHTSAQLAADAGADFTIGKFSQDNSWTGSSETVLQDDGQVKTTYTSSITGDSKAKVITVTGKAYWPANQTTPNRSVTIYIDLRPVTSGAYSVITGAGGLYMSNSSKVVGGDVFINGEITMSNTAQIGLSTAPLNIQVAHQLCPIPPDATFPRVCNPGENGEPIRMQNSAQIYGTVKANNQTTSNNMNNPGLVPGSVTPQPLPTYDRNTQKAAVINSLSGASASCSNQQTLVWPANTKITGDVNISGKCKVTVEGNIWITGKLSISNSAIVAVADSLGSTRPNIMVDGQTGVNISNSATLASNTANTGFQILTFYSKASCSPDCSSVTGPDLANSRSVTTINLNNSASGPNTTFYAYWTRVNLTNGGSIGAVIGQTINMSNSATITFGSSSSPSSTVWVIKGYRR